MPTEGIDLIKLAESGSTLVIVIGIVLYFLKYITALMDKHQAKLDEKDKQMEGIINKFTDKMDTTELRREISETKMTTAIEALTKQSQTQASELNRLTEELRRAK